mgnify:CR=1 FL=1
MITILDGWVVGDECKTCGHSLDAYEIGTLKTWCAKCNCEKDANHKQPKKTKKQ